MTTASRLITIRLIEEQLDRVNKKNGSLDKNIGQKKTDIPSNIHSKQAYSKASISIRLLILEYANLPILETPSYLKAFELDSF
ncbi:hypothetical protein [Ancylomarina sp.]|uniref:hypothetical protein n=1 Tax=Ancylomarina sp. TaxID=1970196 RepID=UPI003562285B